MDKELLLKALYPHTQNSAIARLFGITAHAVYDRAYRLRLKKADTFLRDTTALKWREGKHEGSKKTHFKKGFTPVNKGKKMSNELKDKVKHTFFKKGNMPHNSYSQESGVITIRTDKRGNDYQFIKLAHGVWEPLHRHVWQQANGAIPKDYIIIFKDFNTMNCQLQNLDCITKSDNMKRNTIQNFPEEVKTNIILTRTLNKKIKKLTNNNQ